MTSKKLNLHMEEEFDDNEEETEDFHTLYFLKASPEMAILTTGIFNVLFSLTLLSIVNSWAFLLVYFAILIGSLVLGFVLKK